VLAVALALWCISIRYGVERDRVTSPDGLRFDVLVHRDGVWLYTKNGAFFFYGFYPAIFSLLRRARRGPWLWAVTVRRSPFAGHRDLMHETFSDADLARGRAAAIADLIQDGQRLWPIEQEL